jgi:uncharacterized protein (DUF1697 family)
MTRYAALLRAVNVGGNNKVPMARLRELAEQLGYTEVATYVQSGNLIVTAETEDAAAVENAVAGAIRADLGLDVEVVVRTRDELEGAVAGNPFAGLADDPARMLLSFLGAQPAADRVDGLDRGEFAPERFEIGERCLYLWYPDGVGRSKMAAAPWARRLGVQGTARNLRTIARLIDMMEDPTR